MKKVQNFWKESHQIIGIDSIILKDGTTYLTEINYSNNINAKKTYNKIYELRIDKKVSLNKLLEDDPDLWSEIQVYGKIDLPDNSRILFGEGEMGNEGFILKLDLDDNLEWSFFSTDSNPFVKTEVINEKIHIFSTHGFSIIIDKQYDPTKMVIDNHLSELDK